MSKRALSFLSLCLAAACLAAEAPAPAPAFPKKKSPVTFDAIKAEAKKSKKDLTRLVGKYLTTTFKAEELRQASGGAIKMEEVASKADLRSGKPEVLLVFHYLMFEEGNQLADAGGQERRRGWGARRGRQDDGAAPEAPAADKKDDQKAAAKNDADKDKKEAEKKAEELEKRKQAFAELAKAESPKKFSGYVCAVLTSEQQFPGIRQARRETIDIYFTDDEDVYAKYLPMGQKAQEDQKRAAADSAVKR